MRRVGCVESAFEVRFGVKCVLSPGGSPAHASLERDAFLIRLGICLGIHFGPSPGDPKTDLQTDPQTDPKRIAKRIQNGSKTHP